MTVLKYLKKHKSDVVRIVGAILLAGVAALYIWAFKAGKLPHAEDGDAFDTIYGLEQ